MKLLALSATQLLLSHICEGVRRPGERFGWNFVQSYSKSVSMAPGPDGRLHSFTRETETSRVGEGPGARLESVVTECRDGECEERRTSDAHPLEQRGLLAGPLAHSLLMSPFSTPTMLDFGFGGMGLGGLGWSWPPVALAEQQQQPLDSVTRTVEVTEENGERKRREFVTRCHNGKCTTEEIHPDGAVDEGQRRAVEQGRSAEASGREAAAGAGAGPGRVRFADPPAAAAPQRPAEVVVEDVDTDSDGEHRPSADAPRARGSAPRVPRLPRRPLGGARIVEASRKSGGAADEGQPAATSAKADNDAPAHSHTSVESVTRTIVIREVDGRRETTEVVERCCDGKCTREVRKTGGEDTADWTIEA